MSLKTKYIQYNSALACFSKLLNILQHFVVAYIVQLFNIEWLRYN